MDELRIETLENRTAFEPGQTISGLVGWALPEPPNSVTLRLFWYTQGKGDIDIGIAEQLQLGTDQAVDAPIFEFVAPSGPCSYSGHLISVVWALELIVEPGNRVRRLNLVVAPGGAEIRQRALDDPEAASPHGAIRNLFSAS